jgi:anti-sigma factor RsiW
MWHHEQHASDEELLLAADGEPGRKARRVLAHVEACPRCRARVAQIESTIAELARAERNRLDAELPPIAVPRAMLRTRLAELSTTEAGIFSRLRIPAGLLAQAAGAAALVGVAALACLLAFRQPGAAHPSAPLLSSDTGVLPNRAFTPGAARQASFAEVCALSHEEVVRAVSSTQRRRVLDEYGIPAAQSDQYEMDYLITPGLGGKDDIRNLWPEPYHVATWNAHAKDILEERLHEMVCSHQLDLSIAQQAIATNWIAAYQRYVQPVPPDTQAIRASSLTQAVSSLIFVKSAETLQ